MSYYNTTASSTGTSFDWSDIHTVKKVVKSKKEIVKELHKIVKEQEEDKEKHLPLFNPKDLDL